MSAYATAANYKAVVGMTDATKDAQITLDLLAVSRYIDGKMRRTFNKDTAATSRIYIVDTAADYLWIDDISTTPTSVEVDTDEDGTYATSLAATDYEMLPHNAAKEPEARPFTKIKLLPWNDELLEFPANQRVRVTGLFGWPAVPEAIKTATIHITAILRLETPRATRRIAELGDTIEASDAAQYIIDKLMHNYQQARPV